MYRPSVWYRMNFINATLCCSCSGNIRCISFGFEKEGKASGKNFCL